MWYLFCAGAFRRRGRAAWEGEAAAGEPLRRAGEATVGKLLQRAGYPNTRASSSRRATACVSSSSAGVSTRSPHGLLRADMGASWSCNTGNFRSSELGRRVGLLWPILLPSEQRRPPRHAVHRSPLSRDPPHNAAPSRAARRELHHAPPAASCEIHHATLLPRTMPVGELRRAGKAAGRAPMRGL